MRAAIVFALLACAYGAEKTTRQQATLLGQKLDGPGLLAMNASSTNSARRTLAIDPEKWAAAKCTIGEGTTQVCCPGSGNCNQEDRIADDTQIAKCCTCDQEAGGPVDCDSTYGNRDVPSAEVQMCITCCEMSGLKEAGWCGCPSGT